MKITLLLSSAYGMRGDVRSTLNLATALSERHDVEVISVRRHKDRPFFPVGPDVTMRSIIDARPGSRRLLPRGQVRAEVALWRLLRSLKSDVLVTTRPALGVQAARHAPRDLLKIAREWGRPAVPAPVKRFYPRLQAVVTATEAAAEEWTRLLDGSPAVHTVPDALPDGPWPRSRMDNRIVAAGGRWIPVKGYDRLIRAFATVADKRPDWRLRLYGGGSEERRLRALVRDLDLHNHVYFMGMTPDLAGEFAKASIVVNTARHGDLGMTVLEAMGCGVPVVAFEGSRGPTEFVATGYNGVLVPEGDGEAELEMFASALLALIDDERRRRSLAAGALDTALRHSAAEVGPQWEKLIADLR
ncbi:glycosyltransferase [Nonomuraea roseoviolacea]|uniref:Glycosyltransferase involved in cell wall biosynthesis n=1 Tax=Nonomuraea roseoviolacea subsp. carminata TaxID=160689 RepID=A0ABT1K146_9ACTN|nr:glycosyltransferase [Nonomuraea roseoviolacea]MCP2347708.1 glycosyltransferase involved in cell wall biosynthesis [Nonomuraea roseoviolacea subsp. carminata]